MKKGFTLIEVMVATMLLSMLVTILTMIFNQSSIAWSTGVASVTALGDIREKMSVCARESENVILDDRGNTILGVTSVWDLWKDGKWQVSQNKSGAARTLKAYADFEPKFREQGLNASDVRDPLLDKVITINGGGALSQGMGSNHGANGGGGGGYATFLVGVHSYGPDGKTGGDNSWDDISTMPEEIVK